MLMWIGLDLGYDEFSTVEFPWELWPALYRNTFIERWPWAGYR